MAPYNQGVTMKPMFRTGNTIKRWSEETDDDCVAALMYLYKIQMMADECKGVNSRQIGFTQIDTPFMTTVAERINADVPITERQLAVMKYKLNGYWRQLDGVDIEPYRTKWLLSRFDMTSDGSSFKKCVIMNDKLRLYFSYDTSLISRIKKLSGRQFHSNKTEKYWTVPLNKLNVKQLQNMGFELPDEALAELTIKSQKFNYDGLLKKLRPYQKAGANRLAGELGMNGLLADEMGLGKSAQALAALWANRKTAFPALVVCPGSLKYNWAREAEMWLPDINVRVLNGQTKRKSYKCREPYEITIINYDILADRGIPGNLNFHKGWGALLKTAGFKTVIFDECHKIKNPKAKRTTSIMNMCQLIPNRIALSGTPIESRPIEFFTTLQLVAPKLFPNYWQFGVRYCGDVSNYGVRFNGASNTQELNDILTDNCMIRRRKADVLADLPAKQRQVIPVQINMTEYEKAERMFVDMVADTDGHIDNEQRIGILAQIEKCKQAAVLGKMKQAIEFIENYLETGKKLVVFATHIFTLDMLQKEFKNISVRVDGSVTGLKRQQAVDKFQNDDNIKLFLGNIKAAGVGLTLTAASDTLTLELGWTPGEHEQAEDRVHRIGQKADSVMAYYMIAQGTIEQKIMQILDEKRVVLAQVLDGETVSQSSMLTALLDEYIENKRSK